jgi:allantoinase
MAMHDVLVRGGLLVTPEGVVRADLAVDDGRIAAIGPELTGARAVIDAAGLHVFPGVVDAHVHFNEPGRTDWEGAASGSRALAAGGGTTFVDMPLNSSPCTVNAAEFARKHAALSASSIADFALWGGLVPGNRDDLAALAEAGAVGFKAFMADSGLSEFPRADDLTLFEGMTEAARLGLPVAVHAESEDITAALSARLLAGGRGSVRDVLASRPVIAEVEAIARATLLAAETGVRLHIVHVSSGRGVAVAAEARARGVDVTIETCPHYLCFTTEDVERIGVAAKCAPPIRDAPERDALWRAVLDGTIDIVGSDHSPASPELKSGDFARAWGGIGGVQVSLAVLLDRGHHDRALPLTQVAALLAARTASRFGLSRKGVIRPGMDADLALVALDERQVFEHLLHRHPISPYLGMSCRGVVRSTIRRGETIVDGGVITARTRGRLVTCTR